MEGKILELVKYEEMDELLKELRSVFNAFIFLVFLISLFPLWDVFNTYIEVTYNNEISFGAFLGDRVFIEHFLVIMITTYF